jgi:two-component system NtrC family sensor kinase
MEKEQDFSKQEHYQTLIQSATDYVVAINRNYQIIMANELFKNEFGAHPNALCYKVWKKKTEKCENCLVAKSFQDGLGHLGKEDAVMKDGRIAPMLVTSTPVKDESGKIIYVLETATDITEKKQLQEHLFKMTDSFDNMVAERLKGLQKSEEKYRTVFERSRDTIILTDPDGKIMEINQTGVQVLGYERQDEVLALESVNELFESKADLDRFQKQILLDGFVTEFETRLIRKNGEGFYALITAYAIVVVTGQITGFSMIIRDITKRKKAQQEIEKRNIELATLNAISMTVSSSLDLNEILHSAIDKMSEILESDSVRIYLLDENKETINLLVYKGISDEFALKSHTQTRKLGDGFLGQSIQDCKVWIVDNWTSSDSPYAQEVIDEGLQSTVYVPLVSKGESLGVMALSSHSPFKFSTNQMELLTAIGNQIGVAVANANLYESYKEAYKKLKEAQEQVIRTEKLASLGKLSATIAHEINNPIAAVLTYIKLMTKLVARNEFKPERGADIARYLGTMASETARCGEIVKNLLAFSRQSKITIENNSIEEIIEKTLVLIAHDLKIKGIRLKKDIEANLSKIQCDFKQIQQILLNLVSNASEAMTPNGTLTVSARHAERKGLLELKVADTGCGIPPENLENIFEPFFTTKEEGKGVGLGLSVAYGIITGHRGLIEVESELGKGSTFTVYLPIAGADGRKGK